MESWKLYLEEGKVYVMENFNVIGNNDEFKLAGHVFKLKCHLTTIFKTTDTQIVARGYHFIPIKSIIHETATNNELIGNNCL